MSMIHIVRNSAPLCGLSIGQRRGMTYLSLKRAKHDPAHADAIRVAIGMTNTCTECAQKAHAITTRLEAERC